MHKLASVIVILVLVRFLAGTFSLAPAAPPEAFPFPESDLMCDHDPYGDPSSSIDESTDTVLFGAEATAEGYAEAQCPLCGSRDARMRRSTPTP